MRFRPQFSPFASLCGLALLLSVALPLPRNGAILGLPSLCPFHNLTGWPCPGCGLTRAFVCCGHGQFAAAFGYHPLGPLAWGATLFCVGCALRGRALPPLPTPWIWTLTVAFVVCWVLRLDGVFPLPAA